MSKITLYHGSSEIISKPLYGKGKAYNDYGQGFYCTEHLELAKEWACTEGKDGFANEYGLEMEGLHVLRLSGEEYHILHWLTLLLEYRKVRLGTPGMRRGVEWLRKHFLLDISDYDVIIGYRADDSYFSFARAFVNNEISLEQLSYAMRLGKLGEQIVLKSSRVFSEIEFLGYHIADSAEYYVKRKNRDEEARNAFFKELEREDMEGIYIRDLLRREVSIHDLRL